jgi:hypothetical protein
MSDIVERLLVVRQGIRYCLPSSRDLDVLQEAAEEIIELRKQVREREQDMHIRIRQSYDKTVADCWKAEVAKKDARIAELEAWKAEEQQFLISAATRLGIAGCEGPGILDAIDQLIAKLKLHDVYREVAEAAIVWQVAGIVAWDSFDRAMSRHYPAIHAAMEEGDE